MRRQSAPARRRRRTHPWPRTPGTAIALQRRLRRRLRIRGGPRRVRLVAGADIAYDRASGRLMAVVVVQAFPSLAVVEVRSVERAVRFPYIPGLLSFREAPAILAAFRRLRHRPDLLLCDGQGIAHPRGIGLASHLGLLLGLPTIGCAKSRLVGTHRPIGPRRGDAVPLCHAGRTVGVVLRTRAGTKPLFVSPGDRIGAAAAARFTLACCRGYRIPEPVRRADFLAGALKRRTVGGVGQIHF